MNVIFIVVGIAAALVVTVITSKNKKEDAKLEEKK